MLGCRGRSRFRSVDELREVVAAVLVMEVLELLSGAKELDDLVTVAGACHVGSERGDHGGDH